MFAWLQRCLKHLRHVSGDDAYERYVAHQRRCHPGCDLLDRRAFYLAEQQRKWSGIKRCC